MNRGSEQEDILLEFSSAARDFIPKIESQMKEVEKQQARQVKEEEEKKFTSPDYLERYFAEMRAQIGEDLKLVDQYFPNQIGKSKFRSLGEEEKGRAPVASTFKAAAKAMDSDEELLTTALSIKNYD